MGKTYLTPSSKTIIGLNEAAMMIGVPLSVSAQFNGNDITSVQTIAISPSNK